MKKMLRAGLSLSVVTMLAPAALFAQNTTFATAASLAISGKGKYQFYNSGTNLNTFYEWNVVAGRSYCAETEGAEFNATTPDTVMTVYRGDTTTVIGTNDDADCGGVLSSDCSSSGGSRVCYIASETGGNYSKIAPFAPPVGSTYYQTRVVETSLYSPWFFSGGGFEAFILIKNNSGTARSIVVTLYNTSGLAIATSAVLFLPANGSRNLQVSAPTPGGLGLANASGGVRISSDAPLGSLSANVTSLNFGQGVSFDTPATPRQDWAPH